MATFEVEDLKHWRRSAILWGLAGIVGSIIFRNPIPWLLMAVGFGCAAGGTSAFFLSRKKTPPVAVNFIAIAALVFLLWSQAPIKSGLGYFFLGALFVAAERTTFGLLGDRIVKDLNHRYREVLSALEPKPASIGLPRQVQGSENPTEAFLSLLPEPLGSEFRESVKEVISIRTFRSLESLAPTHSSLGGSPFLSPDQPWPMRDGEPLDFLAQIDLSQLPESIRPPDPSGNLAFFFDIENQPWGSDAEDIGSAAVIFTPSGTDGKIVMKPGTVPPHPLRMPAGFVHSQELCITESQEDRFYEYFRSLPPGDQGDLDDAHDQVIEASSGYSRILSPPNRIQGDMDSDLKVANSAYGLADETGWTMVLQLDSIDDLGWCWGDAGCLYYYLPTDDLTAGRFDRPWVVLQCH
jgi:Domain of unknown function (DUF1963)